jgi:DNA-directed RNA polymerase specialized sigma24 family protein
MASQLASMKPPGIKRREPGYAPVRRPPSNTNGGKPSPEGSPTWKKLRRFVNRGLTSKERLLITLHYCENLTMAEIGAVLGLPESSVIKMHRNVLERVKTWVLGNKRTKTRVA